MLPNHPVPNHHVPPIEGRRRSETPIGRHALSRRRILAAAGLAAAGAPFVGTPLARAARRRHARPRPIPGGLDVGGQIFHVFPFGEGQEPSTITDFVGAVGVCDVQGTGTASYPNGTTETLLFDTDMRFMKGSYVALDGAVHRGTFGFV